MSEHLSKRQIEAWMMGDRDGPSMDHVRGCPQCRAAVEGFEGTLADFRLAVRERSEEALGGAGVPPHAAPSRSPLLWRGLVVAGVALAAVLAAILVEFPRGGRLGPAEAAADAAFMRQVDADVSQVVPDSMEPLLQLFAVEAPPGRDNQTLER
jgi:hypothetical protein